MVSTFPRSASPDLSIIIINWNSTTFLRKCLSSIHRNAQNLKCEVVVVDNASFDGCDEMLGREFPEVKFVQQNENVGFARANNLGFRHSSGRNVLFLNPDTELLGPALPAMMSFLESRVEAGIVGARLINSDFSIQADCIQTFPTIINQVFDVEYLRVHFPHCPFWDRQWLYDNSGEPQEVEAISGACMMLRRNTFEQVGGFSKDYFMYTEDVDLCYKVKQAGGKVYHLGEAQIIHYGGSSAAATGNRHFPAIMMRESLLTFMRMRRGRVYAITYQVLMALVALLRMLLLGVMQGLTPDRHRRRLLSATAKKWFGIFRWAIGLETWARQTTQTAGRG